MPRTCRKCSHVNPDEALYCFHDGIALDDQPGSSGPLDVGKQPFATPFVFPSGHVCCNFDQLTLACNRYWKEAGELLREGFFTNFLGGIGRVDLAMAAREAVKQPDIDLGLDAFLVKLPGTEDTGPKLKVEPLELNLGTVKIGDDLRTELHLSNDGTRLVSGTAVVSSADWLQLGDGAAAKVFHFTDELRLPLVIRGKALRAGNKPFEGKIILSTSGGNETVKVRGLVPVSPFPEGVLAGARAPREAASKAKASPKEAAPLFESGAVERWYNDNGWSYPVQGPASMGLGAVQQFFEALGLVQPPQVSINEEKVHFAGKVGDRFQHNIKVTTVEPRPVYAYAVSDQPWVTIGKVSLAGKVATLPLVVESIPDQPGETLHATVTVTANGQKRFTVNVTVGVSGTPHIPVLETIPVESESLPVLEIIPEETPSSGWRERLYPGGWPTWGHGIPLGVLGLILLILLIRDFAASGPVTATPNLPGGEPPDDRYPYLGVLFHDKGDELLEQPTRIFGLVMLREKDPANPRKRKKLTFDELGRSNNVCVMLDGKEYLYGHPPGEWKALSEPLGKDDRGEERLGERSVRLFDDGKITITQQVEVIPGEQTRRLDTCLVRYSIANRDTKPRTVGLRFLLDTFIGSNDGVPFTIPGDKRLCDTMLKFDRPALVPDFIQALERQDLANPGTVAHLQLRLGGKIEAPTRLTLGCWPDNELSKKNLAPNALAQLTKWDVPVLPIHTLAPGDSAVTMYWDPQPLARNATREVGFSYGLGAIATAGEAKGKLAVTVGGSFRPGGEFTLTAYVGNPVANQTLSLELPTGFELANSDEKQAVPALPPDAERRTSPVTWKVRSPNRAGTYELKVKASNGLTQIQKVTIQSNRLFD